MSRKMKGLFKGLRYISQIFGGTASSYAEEEIEDDEIQIGFPTDVKHVAHIGCDGPSAAVGSSPSWMNEFKSPTAFQSAPLGSQGDHGEEPEVKWVSEDSRRGNRAQDSPRTDLPDLPKSSRRHSTNESGAVDSPKKKEKSRQSRRSKDKDSSDGSVRSSRRHKESSEASGSSTSGLPDIPKKSRRKKSKDSIGSEGSLRRSKGGPCNDPFSDLGPEPRRAQLSPTRGIKD